MVYWLMKLAAGPTEYIALQECFSHWFVQLCLLGWTFAMFYHLCNGIRHLFWDIGKGFDLENLHKSGYAVLISSTILTVITVVTALSGGA
ncbi:hypothetical protein NBRC116583_09470 [Arenicella sp. 4NH20-0111]